MAPQLQFTSDLLRPMSSRVGIRSPHAAVPVPPGPVFTQLLLAMRSIAPAEGQSALLEAMEERQVSVDALRIRCPSPFSWRRASNMPASPWRPEAEPDAHQEAVSCIGKPEGAS